jgi:hypothetical protein
MTRKALILLFVVVTVLATATAVSALQLRAGDILVNADGGFTPKALPRHTDAPITIHGGGRISTVSGDVPPILETINIEFDRHGSLQTAGLEVCTRAKLEATTVAQARRSCPEAIVGTGHGHAVVYFPEQRPIPADSPITLFNGPRKGGNATVIAHAYTTVPVATTFIVPIVIERIHKGLYGYRTKARIPRIANGYGVPISGYLKIGKKWTSGGVKHSYVNARCETGRLQARGQFEFNDGTFLSGTFLRPCQVR